MNDDYKDDIDRQNSSEENFKETNINKKERHELIQSKQTNFDEKSDQSELDYQENEVISKPRMDKGLKAFLWIFGIVISFALIFFTSSIVISYIKGTTSWLPFSWNSNNEDNSHSTALNTVDRTETEGTMTAEVIYSKVAPSIVGVVTYNPSQGLISSSAGQGSGIIMSADGYIITNAHVVGNSNKSNVTVVKDEKEYPAKLIGFDTRTDLAVLKINATGLTPAQFGNSDQLAVGEWVLAIGNPGGLENSLTRGLVSALNRSIGSANSLVKFIQTDAAINPGNSGGALLNMYGQVVGINSSKLVDYEGMGFAIPVNTAKTVVDDIINRGYVSGRVRLGISVRQISAYEAQLNNVPQGLLILEISNDSDVSSKGIRVGDIITKIDGISTDTTSTLYGELAKHSPGDTATLTIYRTAIMGTNSTTFDARVTLLEDKG
ncbi:MAG: hypothetical protein RUMPE_01071 [Eubacteriales bacterium SKADARSKE-1]|nr:hypothetical protein [Eubacteriales bacterium SKADARSKE-1]